MVACTVIPSVLRQIIRKLYRNLSITAFRRKQYSILIYQNRIMNLFENKVIYFRSGILFKYLFKGSSILSFDGSVSYYLC